jgi:hypothetical protein
VRICGPQEQIPKFKIIPGLNCFLLELSLLIDNSKGAEVAPLYHLRSENSVAYRGDVLDPDGEVEVPVVPVPVLPLIPGLVVLVPVLPPMSGLVLDGEVEVPGVGLVLGTVHGEFGVTSGVVPGCVVPALGVVVVDPG